MKSYKHILSAFALILSLVAMTNAQNEISEEKKKLISQVVVLTKLDKQLGNVMDIMLASYNQSYEITAKKLLVERKELTSAQRARAERELITKHAEMAVRFNKKLHQELNYNLYIQETVYPLYDKFYSEAELKDIVAFYQTPTGQKMIDVMPQMLIESMRLTQQNLLPKIIKIVDDLIKEDVNKLGKTSPDIENK